MDSAQACEHTLFAKVAADPDHHRLDAIVIGHAVTIAAHLNVTVPADLTKVAVAGIEVRGREPLVGLRFGRKALTRRLPELSQWPLIGHALQPL